MIREKKPVSSPAFSRRRRRGAGPLVSAVVVAAGSSRRMEGIDKLTAPLLGRPVLGRTLEVLQSCPGIDELVLVLREGGSPETLAAASGFDKLRRIVSGGDTRTESAYLGVMACDPGADYILIHDGARPLVTEAVVRAALEGAREFGAAVPVTPVTDTVKVGEKGFAAATPPRDTLFAAQTPQAFRAELIKAALQDAVDRGLSLTDDCAAVERLGMRVKLVEGDSRNRKITLPSDLKLAEALWEELHP